MRPRRAAAVVENSLRRGSRPARWSTAIALSLVPSVVPAGASERIEGPDAAVCERGSDPSVLVRVSGFKTHSGRLRVQLYGGAASDFLRKGAKLSRIDIPVTSDPMALCVRVPQPGRYAIAVRHDRNGNGKSDLADGAGFSRNPKIKGLRQPRHDQVAFEVGSTTVAMPITLLYLHGLRAEPIVTRP